MYTKRMIAWIAFLAIILSVFAFTATPTEAGKAYTATPLPSKASEATATEALATKAPVGPTVTEASTTEKPTTEATATEALATGTPEISSPTGVTPIGIATKGTPGTPVPNFEWSELSCGIYWQVGPDPQITGYIQDNLGNREEINMKMGPSTGFTFQYPANWGADIEYQLHATGAHWEVDTGVQNATNNCYSPPTEPPTDTPTATASPTETATATATETQTATLTVTASPTATYTATATLTGVPTDPRDRTGRNGRPNNPVCEMPDGIWGLKFNEETEKWELFVYPTRGGSVGDPAVYEIDREGTFPDTQISVSPKCWLYTAFADEGSDQSDIIKWSLTGKFIEKVTDTEEVAELFPSIDNADTKVCWQESGNETHCNDGTMIENAANPVVAPNAQLVLSKDTEAGLGDLTDNDGNAIELPSLIQAVIEFQPDGSGLATDLPSGIALFRFDLNRSVFVANGAKWASFQDAGRYFVSVDRYGRLWIHEVGNPSNKVEVTETEGFEKVTWFTKDSAYFSTTSYESNLAASTVPVTNAQPAIISEPAADTTVSAPICADYQGDSLVDCLKIAGGDYSFEARAQLAYNNGLVSSVDSYDPTNNGWVNEQLLNILRGAGN